MNSMLDGFETELERLSKPVTANNSTSVVNSIENQEIATAEFEAPVIFADVLHYEPGELGDSEMGREGADVYYSPEAVSDPEYIETVKRSPVSIGDHDKNKSEATLDVGGWPTEVYYDSTRKGLFMKGVVIGEKNVSYVKENKNSTGFGTSARIKFLTLRKESGVAPSGKPYTAIATKLVNDHTAILPNIRDRKNAIMAVNAVREEMVENSLIGLKSSKKSNANIDYRGHKIIVEDRDGSTAYFLYLDGKLISDKFTNNFTAIEYARSIIDKLKTGAKNNMPDKEEIKSVINEIEEDKKKESALDEIKNALNSFDERLKAMESKAENSEPEKTEEKTEEKAQNALPSQELLKTIGGHYDIDFKTTPSFMELGAMVGLNHATEPEMILALNSKKKEILLNMTVVNSETVKEKMSLEDALNKGGF